MATSCCNLFLHLPAMYFFHMFVPFSIFFPSSCIESVGFQQGMNTVTGVHLVPDNSATRIGFLPFFHFFRGLPVSFQGFSRFMGLFSQFFFTFSQVFPFFSQVFFPHFFLMVFPIFSHFLRVFAAFSAGFLHHLPQEQTLQRCLASLEEFQRNARQAKERMMQERGVQLLGVDDKLWLVMVG